MKATFHFQVLMYYKATIIQYSTITITDRQLRRIQNNFLAYKKLSF